MGEPADDRAMTPDEFRLRVQIETTLLVWVRTSLALMGFGFVVARFGFFLREIASVGHVQVQAHPHLALVNSLAGTFLITLGVAVLSIAVVTHHREVAQLESGSLRRPSKWSMGVILSLILAALGMSMAVYLSIIEL